MRGELTCISKRTATTIHGRLIYLDLYPGLCQTAIDENANVWRQRCDGQRIVDSTTCDAKVASTKAAGWRPLELVGIGALCVATGFAIGKLVH